MGPGRSEVGFMQLSVRDVAKFLKVSESTVVRWIKQRGLPAQYVAGQYRFNRAELLDWATARQVPVAVELFDRAQDDPLAVPSLVAALEAGGIHYQLRDSSKEKALAALVDVLPLP